MKLRRPEYILITFYICWEVVTNNICLQGGSNLEFSQLFQWDDLTRISHAKNK